MHKLNCTGNSTILLLGARLSGSTNFVAVTNVSASTEIDCIVETWFSIDDRTKVVTRITAFESERTKSWSSDGFFCSSYGYTYTIRASMSYKLENVNGIESVLVTFSESHSKYFYFLEVIFHVDLKASLGDWKARKQATSRDHATGSPSLDPEITI